ncbi:MAG: hypothetical protein ABI301_00745, partial [Jatrophihabitantaceae bacterium]
SLIHWLIAFVWAVEPSAFSVPVEHTGAPAAVVLLPLVVGVPELVVLPGAGVVVPPPPLLLLPQAASATAPTRSPAATPVRLSFTLIPFVNDLECRVRPDVRSAK